MYVLYRPMEVHSEWHRFSSHPFYWLLRCFKRGFWSGRRPFFFSLTTVKSARSTGKQWDVSFGSQSHPQAGQYGRDPWDLMWSPDKPCRSRSYAVVDVRKCCRDFWRYKWSGRSQMIVVSSPCHDFRKMFPPTPTPRTRQCFRPAT